MGYDSLYVDKTYGRGLMPLNFEGLKKQRFRWAFGGMQVMRLHWAKLLPRFLAPDPGNKLTMGQKFDYWSGDLQWFNDPITFLFTVIVLINALSYTFTQSVFLEPIAGAGLFVPFVFIVFSLTRTLWALRVRLNCSAIEAFRAMQILLSLTWVVTLACTLGLTKKAGVFLRTPKQKGEHSLWRSLRIVNEEIVIALLCLGTVVALLSLGAAYATVWLLSGLLLWQAFIYSASVVVTRWSYMSESLSHNESARLSSRTTGLRFGEMIGDYRAVVLTSVIALAIGALFYTSIHHAPEKEIAYRANPDERPLVAHELINNPPDVIAISKIYIEQDGAIKKDINEILKLWDPNGTIRDANYTPKDTSDDRVWQGLDGIRARYEEEFRKRTYLSLKHHIVSTVVEGDRVTIVNDLSAMILHNGRKQKVFLSKGDRWVFRNIDGQWKITSLTVNRALR